MLSTQISIWTQFLADIVKISEYYLDKFCKKFLLKVIKFLGRWPDKYLDTNFGTFVGNFRIIFWVNFVKMERLTKHFVFAIFRI